MNRPPTEIHKLHSAITTEKLWQACRQVVPEVVGFHHMLLGLPSVEGYPAFMRTTMPMPDDPDYFEELGRLAPSKRFIMENPGAPVGRMSDMLPAPELLSSEFYEKVMRPEGWRYAAGIFFWENGGFIGHLALNRTEKHGDFSDEEMNVLLALHEELRIAVLRVRTVERDRALMKNLKTIMTSQPAPLALLDFDGGILFQSSAFADACAEWSGAPGNPSAPKLPDDLRDCLEALQLKWCAVVTRRSPLKVDRSHGSTLQENRDHPTIDGFTVNFQVLENAHSGFAGGQVKVEFTRPFVLNGHALDSSEVQSRLTPCQQRVGRLIVQGLSYSQAADELGLSENTVRNHLARIYKTLKINSRSQLAALLLPGDGHAGGTRNPHP